MSKGLTTTQRGYGRRHEAERRRWQRIVATGSVLCARCGLLIDPNANWHLDHTDDRSGYLGPSHAWCNNHAGGRKGGRVTARRKRAITWSRDWL